MALTPKQIEFALKTTEEYKKYFGFSDWKIRLDDKTDVLDDKTVAECEFDYFEKTLTLIPHKPYLKAEDPFSILIHELIHARIGVAQEKCSDKISKIEYLEEEDAINDITRGFIKIMEKSATTKKK